MNQLINCFIHLLCSHHLLCASLSIIGAENFCQPKIRNFRFHVLVQENVTGLKVSVYDAQPRVLVEIQQTLGYPFDYHTSFIPINQSCSVCICRLESAFQNMKESQSRIWLKTALWVPNIKKSKLLFGKYSYTNSFSSP